MKISNRIFSLLIFFAFLFDMNAQNTPSAAEISVKFDQIGLQGTHKERDMWSGTDLGKFKNVFKRTINSHGAGLYRIN